MSVTNKLKHQRTARDKFFGKVMERNYVVMTFIQKSIPLKKPRVAIFADMIKILTKISVKTQKKVVRIRSYLKNEIYICIS